MHKVGTISASALIRLEWTQKALALPEPTRGRFFCYLVALLHSESPRAKRYWQMVEDGTITSVEQLVTMYYENGKRRPPLTLIEGGTK